VTVQYYYYARPVAFLSAIIMASGAGDDPFRDPSLASTTPQPPPPSEGRPEHADAPDTLAVGRNASLTLGTDSLIVLGTSASRTAESMR
jgi:hypothetical protein